jgi:hypothetical protein
MLEGDPFENFFVAGFALALFCGESAARNCRAAGFAPEIVVSVADQELALIARGKVGDGLLAGAVIKNRNATGEIVKANAPGRDAIVSRVIWLRGMDGTTVNTRGRCIYIHGTAEEQRIGRRASFGCIRMRSKDVIVLYNVVHIGTHVRISAKPLHEFLPPEELSLLARAD